MDDLIREITQEAKVAQNKFGNYTSTHEAFGVLSEEVSELLAAIRANDQELVWHEAVQVSAVAARLAKCCSHANFGQRSGFNTSRKDAP